MTKFAKCLRCGNALPCFSIEWSNLPDDQKCRCAAPVYPEPPISELLRALGQVLALVLGGRA
jgi:hypothetical protein